MAILDSLLPDLRFATPGATDAQRSRALVRAARDFFMHSEAWRDTFVVTTDADGTGSLLSQLLDESVEAYKIVSARIDDREADIATSRTMVYYDDENSSRLFVQLKDDGVIQIYPKRAATVTLNVVLIPMLTASGIPDQQFNLWYRGILAGALYQMLSMPQQAWTDYNAANHARAEMAHYITQAKLKADGWGERRVRVVKYGGL